MNICLKVYEKLSSSEATGYISQKETESVVSAC